MIAPWMNPVENPKLNMLEPGAPLPAMYPPTVSMTASDFKTLRIRVDLHILDLVNQINF